LIEDSTTRESLQQLYDNSRNLQSQMDALVGAIQSADTLDELKALVTGAFE
jgi:hypothetical protein